ncbi:MAG: ferredoxin [Pirellulales bacterium]|nr:ferredoxin [Pirellulales bacterium]
MPPTSSHPAGEFLVDRGLQRARQRAQKLQLPKISQTITICVDRREAGCASAKQMAVSWKFLKNRRKELGLSRHGGTLRLKMQCCGICAGGPVALVMPDRVWYGRCTPEVLERIIQEHLLDGQIVSDYVIARPKH